MSDDTPSAERPSRGGPPRKPMAIDGHVARLLAAGEDVFFAALELSQTPIALSDPRQPDNPLVFANGAFLSMTGYAAEEIVGRNCRFLQGAETDRETVAQIRRAIEERREVAAEILNYRRDGYAFWNALSVAPIFGRDGELLYFFAFQLDVTRRREAEDSLRQAQKLEAIGRLTGGIAHDFNNLLQVMVGYLELIGSGLGKPEVDVGKLARHATNARSAADRAAALTQQLLAFARKQRLEGRALKLNDIVRSLRDMAVRMLGEDIAAEFLLDETIPDCRVDPAQIETALLNVLINARNAMAGRHDKRLVVRTREVQISPEDMPHAHRLSPGRYAAVEVADNGAGIPPEIVERAMDPFFITKEERHGTGLGLSMAYGFAKQSGGAAWISSEDGKGTVVSMVFPAVGDAAPAQAASKGLVLDRPSHETILIVEDRRDLADLACVILADLGYAVLTAPDGESGLAMLAAHPEIDLLFTELVMPGGMNGAELGRAARRLRPAVKVLLTTGYAEASIERSDAGGREFDLLNKPYDRRGLTRMIRVILDGPTGAS